MKKTAPKTTLVFLHPHFTLPGGAGNVVLESARRLDPELFDIHILCIRAVSYTHLTLPTN